MILTRDFFLHNKERVRDEIYCVVPSSIGSSKISEIASDAFLDWESLQYVSIPSCISVVDSHAFRWENIKYLFMDRNKTIVNGMIPSSVKVLSIVGNEEVIFEMLNHLGNIQKLLSFNPDSIREKDIQLTSLTKKFLENVDLKEKEVRTRQEEMNRILDLLQQYSLKTKEVSETILKELEETIQNVLKENVESQKQDLDRHYLKIQKKLLELNDIITKCSEAKEMMVDLERSFDEKLSQKKKELQKELEKASKEIQSIYKTSKETIIKEMVQDATEALIQKNPCRQVIIQIPNVENKFSTKDLFHKDFEDVLSLVALKKPILLKGPAGSGKNVILEQVARALDLQFYYLNDVTEEYKVMGFVDANGRFVETQFFKAFTKGGLMFIDEIDNSNPSALLSINAAIGTGYNHYMAFPDGNFYKAHDNFHLVAAANTFGTGSDAIYCGRQALDGASLNRFLPITIDYDRDLERNLISNTDILDLYWNVRDVVISNSIRHVISTRNIKNASDLIDSKAFDLGKIYDWTIIGGLDNHDLNIISSRITGSDYYSTEFVQHLKRNYKVSSKL